MRVEPPATRETGGRWAPNGAPLPLAYDFRRAPARSDRRFREDRVRSSLGCGPRKSSPAVALRRRQLTARPRETTDHLAGWHRRDEELRPAPCTAPWCRLGSNAQSDYPFRSSPDCWPRAPNALPCGTGPPNLRSGRPRLRRPPKLKAMVSKRDERQVSTSRLLHETPMNRSWRTQARPPGPPQTSRRPQLPHRPQELTRIASPVHMRRLGRLRR